MEIKIEKDWIMNKAKLEEGLEVGAGSASSLVEIELANLYKQEKQWRENVTKERDELKLRNEQLCRNILESLAGLHYPTPEETYRDNITWAIGDLFECLRLTDGLNKDNFSNRVKLHSAVDECIKALGAEIQGKTFLRYLGEQFPAAVGHIPLIEWRQAQIAALNKAKEAV